MHNLHVDRSGNNVRRREIVDLQAIDFSMHWYGVTGDALICGTTRDILWYFWGNRSNFMTALIAYMQVLQVVISVRIKKIKGVVPQTTTL